MTDTALDILPKHYTGLYKTETSDSPDKSRTSLIRWIQEEATKGLSKDVILNIGSGPQPLEAQMLRSEHKDNSLFKKIKIFTLDIANIRSSNLLVQRRNRLKTRTDILHVQGSAFELPYRDNSIGMVVSNHAIDFLPDEVFKEAYRVLAPNGLALFNFHHPSMIPEDLEKFNLHENVREFWKFLKDNNRLFDSEGRIKKTMEGYGFQVNSINLNDDLIDKW